MQGAENGLMVSGAPEPSWLPQTESGETTTFLWPDGFWRCVEHDKKMAQLKRGLY